MNSVQQPSGRVSVTVHDADNVATVLDSQVEATRLVAGGPIQAGIPFGHKVALSDIAFEAPVVKYGVVIGHATVPIAAGEHVHIHNVR